MNPRVLSIWLPNWPIQRLHAASNLPAGPDRPPLVLIARDPRRGQRVVACCRRAAMAGIKVEMSGGEATSLIEAATDAQSTTQPHDAQADLEALQELAAACTERFSPLVGLEPLGPRPWAGQLLHMPQGLVMDVTGIGPLFDGEESLCRQIDEFFQSRNLQVRIALASTLAAAWGLARSPASRRKTVKTTQRYCITKPETEFHHLVSMPTRVMRLEPACVETLARLGIEQFGQLLRLPREGLATRLGADLMLRIDQLLGRADEPLPVYHHRPEDHVSIDLEHPTRDTEILIYSSEQLMQRLVKGLRRRGHGALRIACRFELLQHEAVEMRLSLFAPTADDQHLNRLLANHFGRQRLPADVHRVAVSATLTAPLQQRQPDLIGDASTHANSAPALANLIDNLAGRLGRQSVLGVRATRNPEPESAYRTQPLTGQPVGEIARMRRGGSRSAVRKSSRSTKPRGFFNEQSDSESFVPSPHDPLRRPIQLLKEPIELTVLKIERGTPPMLFGYRDRQLQTHRFWGPERIETAWWSGSMIRRDYFRIETNQGDWLWVYRKLTTSQWYLHGLFG
ncbi:Y-family DNA polymerase [Rosistilla ulvae]|nr:DNA polymerase Y family protein [Rosistilla ulvae]